MSLSQSACSRSSIEARLRACGCVYAEEEAQLLLAAADGPEELASMVARRADGLPLEPILGWAEFHGLRITVEPEVFVPRRRTEFLVDQAAALADGERPVVVDLCCGAGAVGAALAATLDRIELYATDLHPTAVRCARRNIAAHGRVYEGDLYEPLPTALRGRVDVLAVNAPYVPSESLGMMPPEARVHEPRLALDGGADGLDVQRRVAAEAPLWLAPGGHLLIETGEPQAQRTADVLERNGLVPRVTGSEDLGATVVVGTLRREAREP